MFSRTVVWLKCLNSSFTINGKNYFMPHSMQKPSRCYSSAESSSNSGHYDLQHYQLPFTDEQTKHILSILNTASKTELTNLKLPKTQASKICVWRDKRGELKDLKELAFVAELGFKKIEQMCEKILECKEASNPELVKQKNDPLSLQAVKPKLMCEYLGEQKNIVGVTLRGSTLAWCELNRPENIPLEQQMDDDALSTSLTVKNIGYYRITECIDCDLMYQQLQSGIEFIPKSFLYVLPAKESPVKEFNSQLTDSQLNGMLIAALDSKTRQNIEVSSTLYFISESTVKKSLLRKLSPPPGTSLSMYLLSNKNSPSSNLHVPQSIMKSYSNATGVKAGGIERALLLSYYMCLLAK